MSVLANFDLSKVHVLNPAETEGVTGNSILSWESDDISLTSGLATVKTPFKKIQGVWVISSESQVATNSQILAWEHSATAGSIDIKVWTTSSDTAVALSSTTTRIKVIARLNEQIGWSIDYSQCCVLNPPDVSSINQDSILYWDTDFITLTSGSVDAVKTPFTKILGAWVISADNDAKAKGVIAAWQHSATAKCIDLTGMKITSS